MFQPKTFLELAMAMKTRAEVTINGHEGIINGITAEDGSGHCWNVIVQPIRTVPNGFVVSHGIALTVFFREA